MLQLPAILTHDQAAACAKDLVIRLAQEPVMVVLDAAALKSFDSSALAVVLEVRRACARLGKELRVQGSPTQLLALATLYGVQTLLAPQPQQTAA